VHADVYDPFVEAFVEHAATLRVGDPMDPSTDVGPMASAGMGRELGVEGLEAFMETKHVHIESVLEMKDWWYPYG
jgi:acyl-CoA reductase-like NAD-dependent aldehyde dehydrogenase